MRKFDKTYGEVKAQRGVQNIRGCILQDNPKGLSLGVEKEGTTE